MARVTDLGGTLVEIERPADRIFNSNGDPSGRLVHAMRQTRDQVPAGFEQKLPAAGPPPRLEEGKTYEAAGPLIEVPDAYVRFRIQNGKAVKLMNS